MLTYDLSERGSRTMYEFLYEKIKEDILQGHIAPGSKLPSKRGLSEHLDVSIKTVENSYAQLALEGYIETREKSGYYVNQVTGNRKSSSSFYSNYKSKFTKENYLADFTANNINYDKFPFSQWAKIMRETLTDYDTTLLETVPFNGVFKLRVEIAEYLYRFRGMEVSPDQIIIGAGTEYLYGRLLQLLGSETKYAIENPGYRKITQIYDANKITWQHIDIDAQGINVEKLRESNASAVHVSPGHHYPVGLVMPVGRRRELLDWAYEAPNRYIIEDDYDCEFRMSGRPIPSLQSMDSHHRVIYMNTFSKTMVPSIRVSYMVLPEKLMEKYISTMNFYSCTVSGFEQYALASFMQKGFFERHIRKMITYYRQQREIILKYFTASPLKEICTVIEADAGTHFILKINTSLSDTEIKWVAKEKGILINCLSEYCFASKDKYKHMLLVNYSALDENTVEKAVKCLEEIFL